MGNFFAELKRRHIYRVSAAYAVAAWGLLHVDNLAPALRIPDWGISLVLVMLVVGFPIVLIFAWLHELGLPSAGSAPQPASTGVYLSLRSIDGSSRRRMMWTIIPLLR